MNNQFKLQEIIKELNQIVCEREELIYSIALALLTGKNLFILGDTGQAKSFAITEFCKRILGAKQFEKLMSKQADEAELFGRLDLSSIIPGNISKQVLESDPEYVALLDELRNTMMEFSNPQNPDVKENMVKLTNGLETYRRAMSELKGGEPVMITKSKIPDSHICFLDELFKANEGVLNSLLTALNERKWTNEGHIMELPVISFFSASNEIPNFTNPEEKILKPLFDRFELKVLTNYVDNRNNRLNMLKFKQASQKQQVQAFITLNELMEMQAEVALVIVGDSINELMDDILCELRKKGIHVSDRKFFNYAPIVQAEAWLSGALTVERVHLLALKNYLWNKPEEITVVDEVLQRLCINPLAEKLKDIVGDALESLNELKTTDKKAAAIVKLRSEYVRLYDRLISLQNGALPEEQMLLDNTLVKLEDFSTEAHNEAKMTYAPLNELKILQNPSSNNKSA